MSNQQKSGTLTTRGSEKLFGDNRMIGKRVFYDPSPANPNTADAVYLDNVYVAHFAMVADTTHATEDTDIIADPT